MGVKAALSVLYAKQQIHLRSKWVRSPLDTQIKWMKHLVAQGKYTVYGKDKGVGDITDHRAWRDSIPVVDYEGIRPYMERVLEGEQDVLWPGRPLYVAKTSGTTSGAKYIPLTEESMPFHIRSAKMALLSYIHESGNTEFVDGKMLFLQGSPALTEQNGLKIGRLSGITAHHVPAYLQRNRVPTLETNLIEDWEQKVMAIVKETSVQDMRLISGIPSWMQMYFEKLLEHSGKETVKEVFPNFSLMVHGGVNYRPYQNRFLELIGAEVDNLELYPASEGFIAYQDTLDQEGLLLELNSGIFYEFIPADEFFNDEPKRLWLDEIELGVNYVLIINSVAGLWGYNIGDTVKFVSKDPYRIVVTGRIKHFTSAFGEHVIAEEVERAMEEASKALDIVVSEFHVAPEIHPQEGLPYHEWFIEMEERPSDIEDLTRLLEKSMVAQNPYYRDLIEGKVLRPLVIRVLPSGSFKRMMESRGKLGGQNKVPRLANDRKIADLLTGSKA
ncbi:MAG: GH3 auxin-responsive promoter family protein [Flavobacteriales bacterium]|nr:GH3 auxin-responsive promoter family protein [Flavobacteriales bacterium]